MHFAAVGEAELVEQAEHCRVVEIGVNPEAVYALPLRQLHGVVEKACRHAVPPRTGSHGETVQDYETAIAARPFALNVGVGRFAIEYCPVGYYFRAVAQYIAVAATDVGRNMLPEGICSVPLLFPFREHFVAGVVDDGHDAVNIVGGGFPEYCLHRVCMLCVALFHAYQFVLATAEPDFFGVCEACLVFGIRVGVVEVVVLIVESGCCHFVGQLAAR